MMKATTAATFLLVLVMSCFLSTAGAHRRPWRRVLRRLGEVETRLAGDLDSLAVSFNGSLSHLLFIVESLKEGVEKLANCCKVVEPVEEPPCPDGWGEFETSCYFFTLSKFKNWEAAAADCESMGGFLVETESVAEREFIMDMTATSVWVGATRDSDSLVWTWKNSGQTVGTDVWLNNMPDSRPSFNCAYLDLPGFPPPVLQGIPCNYNAHYVCEKPKE